MSDLRNEIIQGDSLTVLKAMPSGIAHCVVSSPPYWALRSYIPKDHPDKPREMGSEPTAKEYIERMVELFREVRRVMRDDGTLWLNMGGTCDGLPQAWVLGRALVADGWTLRADIIWDKSRCCMPESVHGTAFVRHKVKTKESSAEWEAAKCEANQTGLSRTTAGLNVRKQRGPVDNWLDCPGCPTCTPNGGYVLRRDSWRPTRAHEYVLQLVKGTGYYSDAEAVKVPSEPSSLRPRTNPKHAAHEGKPMLGTERNVGRANPRDVQRWPIEPSSLPHFAAFPLSLPAFCIRASTAEKCCGKCGAPWARVIEKAEGKLYSEVGNPQGLNVSNMQWKDAHPSKNPRWFSTDKTIGFRATCECEASATQRALVLDPFCGTGTTCLAAKRLGRDYIGIELNERYCNLARMRLNDKPETDKETVYLPLFRRIAEWVPVQLPREE